MKKKRNLYEDCVKRILDVSLCSCALVCLSPVFAITAAAIYVSSPGSVFYHSDRLGKNRIPFHFYKFRTMHPPKGKDKGMCVADQDRLFPVGRVARRLKIDELPQLINVIRGDMSIVGPRPMIAGASVDFYSGKYEAINSVRPGLTSAASLYDYIVGDTYTDDAAYRREVLPVKLELELLYVKKQSFLYDAELVMRTIVTILAVMAGKKDFHAMPELDRVSQQLADAALT